MVENWGKDHFKKIHIYYPRLVIPKENPSELAYVQSSERIKVESSILFCVNIKYVQKYFNELMWKSVST